MIKEDRVPDIITFLLSNNCASGNEACDENFQPLLQRGLSMYGIIDKRQPPKHRVGEDGGNRPLLGEKTRESCPVTIKPLEKGYKGR